VNKLPIILFVLFFACASNDREQNSATNELGIDSTIVTRDTTTILGETYFGYGTNEYKLFVLNSRGDTILNQPDLYFEFEFVDFNHDSLDDIVVHYLSNVPAIQDLLLFDKTKMGFTTVRNFEKFPDPKPIPGTDYYYSYHRSGCADKFWDSDLFYINDFATVLVANISGNECEGEKGVVVSKMIDGEKKVVEKFPVEVLEKFENYKWGFIADYWTKNYM
jgi:hypothetical protein